MSRGDFVALPQLRCEVATEVTAAWHDDIKIGLLWWSDDERLTRRLLDSSAMHQFEERVRRICGGLHGLSGAQLMPLLRPLSSLRPEQQQHVAWVLDRAFVDEFGPDERARQVRERLDVLLQFVRDLGQGPGPVDAKLRLDEIRSAARRLGRALEGLPRGFWLPRQPPGERESKR
jgi:hypothetical protein